MVVTIKRPPGFYLRAVLAIFAALVVIAIAISAIIAMVFASNADAQHRYCVESPDLLGAITTNINDRDIAWDIQYANTAGIVSSLYIMGPIPFGLADGPLFLPLCGSPSSLACDLTTSNRLNDRIQELNPGGIGLKSKIVDIRKQPWRYYLQLNGSTRTVRASFTQICGTE